ncbi:hypothetical protein [Paraburkholderia aspalathi]|uniref:hypothetical protein n=1 Tax=Paraburkholderia aspalathi TaxID=1324617 RepID=UPI001B03D0FB|nr:hypothetical protein [Paraburkholderia aspalathi]CAE6852625.1 hypothetical protein R20943_07645 [Paraburkholderia aspalathi]
MDELDELFRRTERGDDPESLRRDIAQVIRNRLDGYRDTLGYWEKLYLAGSIADLTQSRESRNPQFWFRFSLRSIWKAAVPTDERNENYTPHDKAVENLTYQQLVEELEQFA